MKAVVAYISFFENIIKQEIVEIEKKDWKLALHAFSLFNEYPIEDLDWMGNDYDIARGEAMNGEVDFCITWLED